MHIVKELAETDRYADRSNENLLSAQGGLVEGKDGTCISYCKRKKGLYCETGWDVIGEEKVRLYARGN